MFSKVIINDRDRVTYRTTLFDLHDFLLKKTAAVKFSKIFVYCW